MFSLIYKWFVQSILKNRKLQQSRIELFTVSGTYINTFQVVVFTKMEMLHA